ncbi:hypothetical protein J6590_026426, partial [Homalodisca vitripennis]
RGVLIKWRAECGAQYPVEYKYATDYIALSRHAVSSLMLPIYTGLSLGEGFQSSGVLNAVHNTPWSISMLLTISPWLGMPREVLIKWRAECGAQYPVEYKYATDYIALSRHAVSSLMLPIYTGLSLGEGFQSSGVLNAVHNTPWSISMLLTISPWLGMP